jgi:hypothetical protein
MRALAIRGMILVMTRPDSSSKVVLVEHRRETPSEPSVTAVRRYRLARLRLDSRSQDPASRFEHLKRAYD